MLKLILLTPLLANNHQESRWVYNNYYTGVVYRFSIARIDLKLCQMV
jgi:hypothetical protein